MIHLDLETYSEADLKRVGSFRYARHPSTKVLCACWSVGNGPVQTWVPGMPVPLFPPDDITGYNIISFDAELWYHVLHLRCGWPWPGWDAFVDAMHQAAYANLPGALGEVAKALNTKQKDAIGATLMMRLCKPARTLVADSDPLRLHTPANIQRLVEYCREDVEAERALAPQLPQLPDFERKVAHHSGEMNRRGIAVDLPLVNRLIALADLYRE
jgi:DNA polymerase